MNNRYEIELVDGKGNRFRAVMLIHEALVTQALTALAQKARSSHRRTAKALGGMVEVVINPTSNGATT